MNDADQNKGNQQPLMFLSSGKVEGNIDGNSKEQWQEVKDNRVKAIINQTEAQGNTGKKNSSTAPVFNPSPARIVSTNGCVDTSPNGKRNDESRNKESTAQWVQRTFNANTVATNTSCQDTPSQDSRVEGELAKKLEKIQAVGAKIRSESDNEEDEVPDGVQDSEESTDDEQEEEEQSVNGDAILTAKITNEENLNNVYIDPKDQNISKEGQVNTGRDGVGTEDPEQIGVDVVDPGGTGDIAAHNVNANMNKKEIVKAGNEQVSSSQPPVETGSTIPLEIVQLKLQKKIEEHAMVPNPRKSNIMAALGDNDVDDQVERPCNDLDEESTTQNFLNVAK
uniref:Nucleolin 1-like n=1 Tax=Nicotiana tabacum TaxID=4097 RepID=A0A1S4ARM0_TOBAC|nr:PREDICTED: nucleolin 1-like [Nicotiana tabacum]